MRPNQTIYADSGWVVMLRRADDSEVPAMAVPEGSLTRTARSVCGRTCFTTRHEARTFLRELRARGLNGRVCEADVRVIEVGG